MLPWQWSTGKTWKCKGPGLAAYRRLNCQTKTKGDCPAWMMKMLKYTHVATCWDTEMLLWKFVVEWNHINRSLPKIFFKPGSNAFKNSLSRELSQLQDKPTRENRSVHLWVHSAKLYFYFNLNITINTRLICCVWFLLCQNYFMTQSYPNTCHM